MKSLEQQDLQSLQCIRERMMKHRTVTGNQLRGLLAEYGVVLPKGLRYLRAQVPLILEDAEQPLTVVARDFMHRLYRELVGHDKQIGEIEKELVALVEQNEDYQRLLTIPGVGPLIATTLLASGGRARRWR